MTLNPAALLELYFRQQSELSVPDHIFSRPVDLSALQVQGPAPASRTRPEFVIRIDDPQQAQPVTSQPSKTSSPVSSVLAAEPQGQPQSVRERLVQLYHESKACGRCSLCSGKTSFVFGAGKAEAPVMIVGEAPGPEEDKQGLPFVGPAGELLTKMLASINLNRSKDVFITNVLKCRPPDDRPARPAEVGACMPILRNQIETIAPKALLLLGEVAAQAVLGTDHELAALRNKRHTYLSIPAIVTYHPAMLLAKPELKRQSWADLQKFRDLLTELGVYGAS